MLFGGDTLTASDIAVAAGKAAFGDAGKLPGLSAATVAAVWDRFQAMLEDGVDRMKTTRGDVTILAVGGGNFLIADSLKGAARVVRPPHAAVANAVGAAIAQVGAQVEQIVAYDQTPRAIAIEQMRADVTARVAAAGRIACIASARSSCAARSMPTVSVRRRAATGSSSARPLPGRALRCRRTAPDRSSRRSPGAPTGGRSHPRT